MSREEPALSDRHFKRSLLLGVGFFLAGLPVAMGGMDPGVYVPVFRHMLEHGESAPYEITIRHQGPLVDEHRLAGDHLLRARETVEGIVPANVVVHFEEQAGTDGVSDAEPVLEVRYPAHSGLREPIWQSAVTLDAVEKVLTSPVREGVAEALIEGRMAVWLWLGSGDRQRDEAARNVLERELKTLSDTLVDAGLYELEDLHEETRSGRSPFVVIDLVRDDPDEAFLVAMLLNLESDLKQFEDQPMVFPVYGRGLVMPVLVGRGIHSGTIGRVVEFLVQDCAECDLEAGMSGLELLMSIQWP